MGSKVQEAKMNHVEIRNIRENVLKLTAQELAERAGYTASSIHGYESGKIPIPMRYQKVLELLQFRDQALSTNSRSLSLSGSRDDILEGIIDESKSLTVDQCQFVLDVVKALSLGDKLKGALKGIIS